MFYRQSKPKHQKRLTSQLKRSSVQANDSSIHPIQRKIGFELEGQWNVRDLSPEHESRSSLEQKFDRKTQDRDKKIKEYIASNPHLNLMDLQSAHNMAELSLMQKGEIQEPPLLGANLQKKDPIFIGNDFILEADNSPSGGSNIEFVTSPLDTKSEVSSVGTDILRIVVEMNKHKADDHIELDDEFFQQTKVKGTIPPSHLFRIYPMQGEISLQPQFTCGFKLHELNRVFEYLNNEKVKKGLNPRKLVSATTGEGSDPLQDLQTSHFATKKLAASSDFTDLPEFEMVIPDISEMIFPQLDNIELILEEEFADDHDQTDFGLKLFGKSPSFKKENHQALIGLIALIATYLIRAQALPEQANAKAIAGGLLSRTDFAHNFSLLSQQFLDYFKVNPDAFIRTCLRVSDMEHQGKDRIYPRKVRFLRGEEIVVTQIQLTREKWLRGITEGKDYLHHQYEEAIHSSLGALGDHDGIEPSATAREHLVVTEFRRIQSTILEPDILKTLLGYYNFYESIKR